MINAKGIAKIVDRNQGYVNIPSRAKMDNMVYFVFDLLRESGDTETANKVLDFYYKLENMDTCEIAKEKIWD